MVGGLSCIGTSSAGSRKGMKNPVTGPVVEAVCTYACQPNIKILLLENPPQILAHHDKERMPPVMHVILSRLCKEYCTMIWTVYDPIIAGFPIRRKRMIFLAAKDEDIRAHLAAPLIDKCQGECLDNLGGYCFQCYINNLMKNSSPLTLVVNLTEGRSACAVELLPGLTTSSNLAVLFRDGSSCMLDVRDARRMYGMDPNPINDSSSGSDSGRTDSDLTPADIKLQWNLLANATNVDIFKVVGESLASPLLVAPFVPNKPKNMSHLIDGYNPLPPLNIQGVHRSSLKDIYADNPVHKRREFPRSGYFHYSFGFRSDNIGPLIVRKFKPLEEFIRFKNDPVPFSVLHSHINRCIERGTSLEEICKWVKNGGMIENKKMTFHVHRLFPTPLDSIGKLVWVKRNRCSKEYWWPAEITQSTSKQSTVMFLPIPLGLKKVVTHIVDNSLIDQESPFTPQIVAQRRKALENIENTSEFEEAINDLNSLMSKSIRSIEYQKIILFRAAANIRTIYDIKSNCSRCKGCSEKNKCLYSRIRFALIGGAHLGTQIAATMWKAVGIKLLIVHNNDEKLEGEIVAFEMKTCDHLIRGVDGEKWVRLWGQGIKKVDLITQDFSKAAVKLFEKVSIGEHMEIVNKAFNRLPLGCIIKK
jgi:hypothetical protein